MITFFIACTVCRFGRLLVVQIAVGGEVTGEDADKDAKGGEDEDEHKEL